MFNRITIIGVGLIGGSIGLAIKKHRVADEVTGVFRRASTLKKALKHRAVDRGTLFIKDGVADADIVILATPVRLIPRLASETIKYAKDGAIITDVGGTKSWITGEIENILGGYPGVSFVGSHPMAGSEHAGVEFARNDLLEGAPCIVTRTSKTDRAALRKIVNFWSSLGAKVKVMTPAAHDRSVSLISHLPHIVAFSLAGAVPEKEFAYAAEGFKDTTRVASSDAQLWADIFLTNRKEITASSARFKKYYGELVNAVSRGDRARVMRLLKTAKARRDKFYGK